MAATDHTTFPGERISRQPPVGPRGLRVALLEDDPVDAELLTRQLARAWPSGVEVCCYQRFSELAAGLAGWRPDVIFCDLSVPDANGIDVVEQAVALARSIPVVVITGSDDPLLPVLALEIGAQDYLAKAGYDVELLARTLRHSMARSRADEAMRQVAADLKAANTELEEYLGIMAHDLRAPLRTGRLFADRLITSMRTGRDGETVASALEASLARAEAMVERLLLLATLREGRPRPTVETLSATVERVAAELAADLDDVGGRFSVETDGPVLIDRTLFADLLRHLTENSIEYRSAERPLQVRFWTATTDSTTEVVVRDNGVGIAPQYQDRVFRLFERLEPGDGAGAGVDTAADGLGFGLACCRRIVELHRGTIAMVSPPDGIGAECRITLPAPSGSRRPGGPPSLSDQPRPIPRAGSAPPPA